MNHVPGDQSNLSKLVAYIEKSRDENVNGVKN